MNDIIKSYKEFIPTRSIEIHKNKISIIGFFNKKDIYISQLESIETAKITNTIIITTTNNNKEEISLSTKEESKEFEYIVTNLINGENFNKDDLKEFSNNSKKNKNSKRETLSGLGVTIILIFSIIIFFSNEQKESNKEIIKNIENNTIRNLQYGPNGNLFYITKPVKKGIVFGARYKTRKKNGLKEIPKFSYIMKNGKKTSKKYFNLTNLYIKNNGKILLKGNKNWKNKKSLFIKNGNKIYYKKDKFNKKYQKINKKYFNSKDYKNNIYGKNRNEIIDSCTKNGNSINFCFKKLKNKKKKIIKKILTDINGKTDLYSKIKKKINKKGCKIKNVINATKYKNKKLTILCRENELDNKKLNNKDKLITFTFN